ncbi:MAG: glycosyltransferase family 4 protein [Planctomycetota bacterium]|jgi:glycosyltransferase involved in cell wall biosynthesis
MGEYPKIAFAHHEPIDPGKARWVAIVRTLAAVASIHPIVWYAANSIEEIGKYSEDHLGLALPDGLDIRPLATVHKRFGITLNKVYFRALRKSFAGDVLWLRSDKLAAFAAHKMPAAKLVYEAHLVGELWSRDKGDTDRKAQRQAELERQLYAGASGVVAISDGLLVEVADRFDLVCPMAVARSAVDTSVFSQCWTGGRNRVVYVGTLQFWKGLETLVDAIALTELDLDIIGDGKEADTKALKQKIDSLGLADRVRLRGRIRQPEIPDMVKDCFCAVHPLPAEHTISARFTSPLKVMEYMAMGLPIVASNVASVTEILEHEHNALLFEAGDPESLATSLKAMSNQTLAHRLSKRAAQDAEQYTYEKRAAVLLELFQAAKTG